MSRRRGGWERHGDPEKRALRKAARRANGRKGEQPRAPRPTAQLDHASNPRARRQARDGAQAMERERLRQLAEQEDDSS
jgi:hypothetical protein